MLTVHDAVRIHAPALEALVPALLAVAELQHRVRRQARTQRGCDVVVGPVDDLDERLPERFQRQVRLRHVGAGDDERVQPLFLDALEGLVVLRHVGLRLGAARELLERKRMHVELRDLVRLAHEPEELAFGGRERGIGHHVQQSDVHLADVLLERDVARNDVLAFLPEALERRQIGIGNQRHGYIPLTPAAPACVRPGAGSRPRPSPGRVRRW